MKEHVATILELVHKVVRAGYYWPTIQADAKAYVKVCDQCQQFSNVLRQSSEYLTPMMAPWPFAQWGLDILGPFPTRTRQMKFLRSEEHTSELQSPA